MDYQIILSPASIASLEAVTAWIAKDNPSVAERIGNELLDKIALLKKFPKAGSVYAANKDWRKLVSRPYIIVYRISPKLRTIEVLAFRHSARASHPDQPFSQIT
ncbi:MAG: type II toxin-antitoxin system RelE/ParE family toxin [Methylacidiphilales bacterium]|nr:type II toxin-antitoxin system RelE/ParE family toxin [Candidatus Methylacidiphilales bacterium]